MVKERDHGSGKVIRIKVHIIHNFFPCPCKEHDQGSGQGLRSTLTDGNVRFQLARPREGIKEQKMGSTSPYSPSPCLPGTATSPCSWSSCQPAHMYDVYSNDVFIQQGHLERTAGHLTEVVIEGDESMAGMMCAKYSS